MIFTHDTEHALAVVVDLINTGAAASGAERLGGLPGLRSFVERNAFSDVGRLTDTDLVRVLDLRARFHAVFRAGGVPSAVRRINEIVGEVRTTPHLTDHDGYDWHVHFFAPGAPLGEHLAADCGMALAYVVAAGELDRLRTCEAPDCARVLVDLSRNRCRRYCDSRTCGNRMHVAAYRARQREAGGPSSPQKETASH
ncbi:CGNR zinc finger domain-containing protein [Actinomadura sp. 7K507]|uniref:CGNR zinc finger domain-containing protein n=1 Tax=Actinomadura sp. 7K507 TaxID=2530365 RepID=UPI00104BADDC|nr:CGNR zinc finger domain-containing protein [Actinomadura sp. 7K507]TDC95333.1 zf-CGNR multi-domain protein [Actinomadura sp. 7K507]